MPATIRVRDSGEQAKWRSIMAGQEPKRVCPMCGKSFKSSAKLEKHLAAHEEKESRFVWGDGDISMRKEDGR